MSCGESDLSGFGAYAYFVCVFPEDDCSIIQILSSVCEHSTGGPSPLLQPPSPALSVTGQLSQREEERVWVSVSAALGHMTGGLGLM